MSQDSSRRPPKYCKQIDSQGIARAYVRLGGKRVYLGTYGTADSRQRYAELIGTDHEDLTTADGSQVATPPTVNEVLVAFLEYAQDYYRTADGTLGREYELMCEVAKILRHEAGRELAQDFGPKRLKAIRETMIDRDLSRKFINKQIDRIRRIFKWAAADEMIPPSVPQALGMVTGLRRGRTKAKEPEPVRPVADADVEATLEHLPQVVADMVRIQRLTGMRPGELVIMCPEDIDRSGPVWFYHPKDHKTAYRGHVRTIAIGPKCQAILIKYLVRAAGDCCFQPRDSEEKRRAAIHAERVTPLSCGNRPGKNLKSDPHWQPGEAYTAGSYRRAITRACKRADVESWTPHRLRHSAATEIRRAFGLDAAQSVLGHRHAQITEVYAELHTQRAAEVALRIG